MEIDYRFGKRQKWQRSNGNIARSLLLQKGPPWHLDSDPRFVFFSDRLIGSEIQSQPGSKMVPLTGHLFRNHLCDLYFASV